MIALATIGFLLIGWGLVAAVATPYPEFALALLAIPGLILVSIGTKGPRP